MLARALILVASLALPGCTESAAVTPSVAQAPIELCEGAGHAARVTPVVAHRSASIGRPNAGALVDAAHMPEGEHWRIEAPEHAFATEETITGLVAAVGVVEAEHPGSPPLSIGELSREFGGRLYPHLSHQSGRDADVGYYYLDGTKSHWYEHVMASTLDRARTWTFVKALLAQSDVEYIFMDRAVQRLLREHALSIGDDPAWLETIFESPKHRDAVVRHAAGHATHIHVRFYSPESQARGSEVYEDLAARHLIGRGEHTSEHVASPGDDVRSLAQRYGMDPQIIRRVNRLPSYELEPGRTYKIPRRGGLLPALAFVVPSRPLPPCHTGTSLAAVVAGEHR